MNITKQSVEAFDVVGPTIVTTNKNESNPQTAQIGQLWRRFHGEKLAKSIPNQQTQGLIIACYGDYESDHNGQYSVTIGCPVTQTSQAPAGMSLVKVPRGTFMVFEVSGQFPQAIIETWIYIWNYFDAPECKEKRVYQVDFERYDLKNDTAHIYIGIKE